MDADTQLIRTATQNQPDVLHELTEDALNAFREAEGWQKRGYEVLFEIYAMGLWRSSCESWEEWLREFCMEAFNRGIASVSVETLQQRCRDYVRLVVGAGVDQEVVLGLPARVANRIASLGEWPRQGAYDYDPEQEGKLVRLASDAIRLNARRMYQIDEEADDGEILHEIVERLSEMPSAWAGVAEIEKLSRGGGVWDEFVWIVKVGGGRLKTECHYAHYVDHEVASTWIGNMNDANIPDEVLLDYARRLGTHLRVM